MGTLLDLPSVPSRLSELALDRMAAARGEAEALLALGELVEVMDPAGEHGRWHVAGRIADRLAHFERGAWLRIRSGGRAPRGRYEALLARVAASDLPRTRRRILDLIE